jgi:hypothetical protein
MLHVIMHKIIKLLPASASSLEGELLQVLSRAMIGQYRCTN